MKKVAFFDIDGTLIKDISSERVFFKYLLDNRIVTITDLLRYAFMFLASIVSFKGVFARRNKYYLKGKQYDFIADEAKKCFNERIVSYISKDGIKEIERLKTDGYKIVLLSGTLDPIMECFMEFCSADEGIATTLKRKNGVIAGVIDGIYAYHSGKSDIIKRLAKEEDIDLSTAYGFGNEKIDIDFLQLLGNPVAVNADKGLESYAKESGWKIVEFSYKNNGHI